MKDFRVEVKLKNNQLVERRLKLCFNVTQLAKAAGLSATTYSGLETMRISPCRKGGEWNSHAIRLSKYHRTLPEDLFPESIEHLKKTKASFTADTADMLTLMSTATQSLCLPEDTKYDKTEEKEEIRSMLELLTPREQEVITWRYGLNGRELSLDEIGNMYNLGRQRISDIQREAEGKLRKAYDRISKDLPIVVALHELTEDKAAEIECALQKVCYVQSTKSHTPELAENAMHTFECLMRKTKDVDKLIDTLTETVWKTLGRFIRVRIYDEYARKHRSHRFDSEYLTIKDEDDYEQWKEPDDKS